MERVKTLIGKLQKQAEQGVSASSMLSTLQMLQAELIQQLQGSSAPTQGKVAIIMPVTHVLHEQSKNMELAGEEKIVEVLQVDEQEIEKELAEIKKHAETMNAAGQHASQHTEDFNPLEDVPTLAQQDRIPATNKAFQGKIEYPEMTEYEESLNDKLKQAQVELSESLTATPIKDLRKAIGVNDRFLFINELFRGDEAMYERSIKTIQGFSIFAEAEYWIRRELKLKLGWDGSDPIVRQFDELIRRRFM